MGSSKISLAFVAHEEGVYEVISTSTTPWRGRFVIKPEPHLLTPPSLGEVVPLTVHLRLGPNFWNRKGAIHAS